MSVKKTIQGGAVLCCLFFVFPVCANEGQSIQKDFIKESIGGKKRIVENINPTSNNFNAPALCALNFIAVNYDLLASDEEFIAFAREAVKAIPASSGSSFALLLEQIFEMNKSPVLQKDILENFAFASGSSGFEPKEKTVHLVNSYAEELLTLLQNKDGSTQDNLNLAKEILLSAIKTLAQFRQTSSFSVLFSCYAFPDKTVSETAVEALNNFAGIYEKSVHSLISDGTLHEKRLALDLVLQNPKNSDFFKAEMSENALSATIYKTGDVEAPDKESVELKMRAVRELYRVSWTRSAALMCEVFVSSRKEYEAGFLNDNQFIEIIYAFTRLAASEASEYLTKYLKTLNKNQEENNPCSMPVVLAVIQSLQFLGDKTAFDDLLYATYQTYPDEVVSAARDALSKLKW